MVPLAAEILTDQSSLDGRAAVRRSLRLGVSAYTSDCVTMALVMNISQTGVLVETVLDLEVGELLQVDMPEASGSSVRVVWREGLLAGCEFVDSVSAGAVSAARLRSSIEAPEESDQVSASAANASPECRYAAPLEGVETAVVIVTALIAMLSVFILIAAIATLL